MDEPIAVNSPRPNIVQIRIDRELGRTMRAARNQAGITLDQVAADLSVSTGTVSQLETGKCRWRLGRAVEFATYFALLGSTDPVVAALVELGEHLGAYDPRLVTA
jgi:transcriptional regulator with XRE-family HTH domain